MAASLLTRVVLARPRVETRRTDRIASTDRRQAITYERQNLVDAPDAIASAVMAFADAAEMRIQGAFDGVDVPAGDARVVLVTSDLSKSSESSRRIASLAQTLRGPMSVGILLMDRGHPAPHIRNELRESLLHVQFEGVIPRASKHQWGVAVVSRFPLPSVHNVPKCFEVVAVMTVFNEADIIESSIRRLNMEGVKVWVIDNWSNDGSFEIAKRLIGSGVITVERYPAAGPTATFDWSNLLSRVEEIAAQIPNGWVVHHDVDEYRMSPWVGVNFRTALHYVESLGFNAVDHTVVAHQPTDNSFRAGSDLVEALPYFEFGNRPGYFMQIKAWRAPGMPIDLASSGGHQAQFPGRRVFPFNFLLRHYPIRSQAQGMKKVFLERKQRWNATERERGWHKHYDSIDEEHDFIRESESLELFDEKNFARDYLFERLLRVGIAKDIS
jgi:hypothetical protein